ncbi:putative phospholipase B-like 2 [Thrips palmi]|uniref:Phospholipase B-like n=1 Tax=Thrips palmi TaxID=161013 RepID=A0A6P9A2V3_THRPL|nr:putative phospholipase B-like 2 [Thrips palmi]
MRSLLLALLLGAAACSAATLIQAETPETPDQQHGPEEPQEIAYVSFDASDKLKVTVLETDDPEEAEKDIPADYVAKAVYRNLINQTGWAYLELQTNAAVDDERQARAAGALEGYLSAGILHMHVNNVARPFCDGRQALCARIQKFLERNLGWVGSMVKKQAGKDVYWHQVKLFYVQQDALLEGYNLKRAQDLSLPELTQNDILWLNVQGDLEDLVSALASSEDGLDNEATVMERGRVLGSGSCSALIKLLPGSKDLFVSHDTWSSYETMLRVQKKYVLNYQMGPGRARSELLPGRAMSFSSYPGVLTSGDDFYIMSTGLVSLETTIGNGNASLWQYVKPVGQVAEGTRSMVANRLATSGRMWTQLFSKYNSGTYNNQWMVVDYTRLVPQSEGQSKSGLLYVLEQLPGFIKAEDLTSVLLSQGYWASYNVPYFKDVFSMGGNEPLVRKFGDWFTFEHSPRAEIFRRDQGKVSDLQGMWRLMRSNDFKNDPLSVCNCTPTHNGENAIAARSDLNPADGKYPWGALGHRNHGATDTKITSKELAASLRFLGESGPPHYSESCPVFSWSTADFAATTPHQGLPDAWKFPPVVHPWAWGLNHF